MLNRTVARSVAVAVVVCVATSQAGALGKGKAAYMGGTITSIKDKTEGPISYQGEEKLVFTPKAGTPLEVPWATVSEIEYGQKAGRRVVGAVLLSPLALFSKNRKHYITLTWTDGNSKEQAAVLQFDKNDIRQALAVIRVRTGKEITFTDEEAQKQMGGSAKKAPIQAAAAPAPTPSAAAAAAPPATTAVQANEAAVAPAPEPAASPSPSPR